MSDYEHDYDYPPPPQRGPWTAVAALGAALIAAWLGCVIALLIMALTSN